MRRDSSPGAHTGRVDAGFTYLALMILVAIPVSYTHLDVYKRQAQTSFSYRVDPGGQVLLTATRSGNGGATAPDAIATLTFRALAAGAAHIDLITIAPVGAGGATINTCLLYTSRCV